MDAQQTCINEHVHVFRTDLLSRYCLYEFSVNSEMSAHSVILQDDGCGLHWELTVNSKLHWELNRSWCVEMMVGMGEGAQVVLRLLPLMWCS